MRSKEMTKYNWDAIPARYNWAAMDSHGIVRAFVERPNQDSGYWVDHNDNVPDGLAELPYVVSWKDWEDSLEERPKPAKRYELSPSSVIIDRHDNFEVMTTSAVVDRLNEYWEKSDD
jgi:hypothetical protein